MSEKLLLHQKVRRILANGLFPNLIHFFPCGLLSGVTLDRHLWGMYGMNFCNFLMSNLLLFLTRNLWFQGLMSVDFFPWRLKSQMIDILFLLSSPNIAKPSLSMFLNSRKYDDRESHFYRCHFGLDFHSHSSPEFLIWHGQIAPCFLRHFFTPDRHLTHFVLIKRLQVFLL